VTRSHLVCSGPVHEREGRFIAPLLKARATKALRERALRLPEREVIEVAAALGAGEDYPFSAVLLFFVVPLISFPLAISANKNRLPLASVAGCATGSARPLGAHAWGGL